MLLVFISLSAKSRSLILSSSDDMSAFANFPEEFDAKPVDPCMPSTFLSNLPMLPSWAASCFFTLASEALVSPIFCANVSSARCTASMASTRIFCCAFQISSIFLSTSADSIASSACRPVEANNFALISAFNSAILSLRSSVSRLFSCLFRSASLIVFSAFVSLDCRPMILSALSLMAEVARLSNCFSTFLNLPSISASLSSTWS
mmetsp:Transcript_45129/g.113521  ORF Transcript_45129/g.113521 Transcript_45129/m.113521 type:complete len:205 (-) Transcript_45129:1267-1881(-)